MPARSRPDTLRCPAENGPPDPVIESYVNDDQGLLRLHRAERGDGARARDAGRLPRQPGLRDEPSPRRRWNAISSGAGFGPPELTPGEAPGTPLRERPGVGALVGIGLYAAVLLGVLPYVGTSDGAAPIVLPPGFAADVVATGLGRRVEWRSTLPVR